MIKKFFDTVWKLTLKIRWMGCWDTTSFNLIMSFQDIIISDLIFVCIGSTFTIGFHTCDYSVLSWLYIEPFLWLQKHGKYV